MFENEIYSHNLNFFAFNDEDNTLVYDPDGDIFVSANTRARFEDLIDRHRADDEFIAQLDEILPHLLT